MSSIVDEWKCAVETFGEDSPEAEEAELKILGQVMKEAAEEVRRKNEELHKKLMDTIYKKVVNE